MTLQLLKQFFAVCLLMRASMSEPLNEVIHCFDCQHCERIGQWSADDWKSVDCGNATCGKRVVSGYVWWTV